MACQSGKIAHASRDAALGHLRELEYKNSQRGRDVDSVGLAAYPCNQCLAWHVGHRHIPTAWHYDVTSVLDATIDAIVLHPARPKRMPKHARRKYSGYLLMLFQAVEERAPMVWFTWNAAWDFSGAPHPGTFVGKAASERYHEGLLRIGVPASKATLRWSDYVRRNATPRLMRDSMTDVGTPSEWLATDQPVPFSMVRSIECWYRGAWIAVGDVSDEDFASYLGSDNP